MNKNQKIVVGIGVLLLGVLFGNFVYNNIIVPWPYRHELKACLDTARGLGTEAEIKAAENVCFRTYPHFN